LAGVAWLIAALLIAGGVAVARGREVTPPRILLRPAQGCIGVLAVAPLAGEASCGRFVYVSVACSAATVAICLLCALVLVRVAGISPATALLSTLAGGASGISTMAPELRVDHRYVALSQYLRLTVVTLTLPVVLDLAGDAPPIAHPTGVSAGAAAVAATVIVGAGHVGSRLRWPAPYLLGPMLVAALIALASRDHLVPVLPPLVDTVAYVVIGWQAGGSVTRSALRRFVTLLPLTVAFIAATIAGCLALAAGVAAWTGLPFAQAYLATTPGGIYAVLATATDSGAGPVVVTMQVIRLLVMYLVAIVGTRVLTRVRPAARRAVISPTVTPQ
jgi:uncharacterized protein